MKSVMERNQEGATCPQCEQNNQIYHLKFMFISLDEMVLKCESSSCMFPFKNFKYKNVTDGSISQPQLITDQKSEFSECDKNNSNETIPESAHNTFIDAFVESLSFDNNSNSEEEKTFITLQPSPMIQYDVPLNYEIVQPESKSALIDLAPLQIPVPQKQTNHNKKGNTVHSPISVPSRQNLISSSNKALDEKPTTSQLQYTMNAETKTESTATATISRYLDLIKAKHKKSKTIKKRLPIKCEKEAKIFNTLQNSTERFSFSGTDKAGNRPLDILKSIQAMK